MLMNMAIVCAVMNPSRWRACVLTPLRPAAGGDWVLVTSQLGQNFYTGWHPGNPHGGYLVPDFVRRSPRFEEVDFAAEANRRAGRPLSPHRMPGSIA